jgi:hypothetical protein
MEENIGQPPQQQEQPKQHTQYGTLALIFGILGIVLLWIPLINIIAIAFAVLAIIFGYLARKQGDSYGLIGLILGIITIVLLVVFTIIAATVYLYVTNMIGNPG